MPRTCVRFGMHADARPAGRVGIPAAAAGVSGTGLASREATPTGDALLSAAKSKTPADAKAAKPAKSGKAFLLIAIIAVVAGLLLVGTRESATLNAILVLVKVLAS